ncbi:MAG: hypothetical protein FWF69_07820 [Firmicutes bacterium]|nr:hypothetical protein [Bacillota bacterium]
MIEKINLKEKVNSVPSLFSYLNIGQLNDHVLNVLQAENRTLNKENTGGAYGGKIS